MKLKLSRNTLQKKVLMDFQGCFKQADDFSNSNTMYLTQRKTQNNLQLQWKCISM